MWYYPCTWFNDVLNNQYIHTDKLWVSHTYSCTLFKCVYMCVCIFHTIALDCLSGGYCYYILLVVGRDQIKFIDPFCDSKVRSISYWNKVILQCKHGGGKRRNSYLWIKNVKWRKRDWSWGYGKGWNGLGGESGEGVEGMMWVWGYPGDVWKFMGWKFHRHSGRLRKWWGTRGVQHDIA